MSNVPLTPAMGMRSILERMTDPTPADLAAGQRLSIASRGDVMAVVNRIIEFCRYLETKRPDVTVGVDRDEMGWTIRILMPPTGQ